MNCLVFTRIIDYMLIAESGSQCGKKLTAGLGQLLLLLFFAQG